MTRSDIFLLAIIGGFLVIGMREAGETVKPDDLVTDVLELLGSDPMPHKPDLSQPGVDVKKGEEIVTKGRPEDVTFGKSRRQSIYFTCTACHNIVREEPNLAQPDPDRRLRYALEHGLPYLQGSPLYGVVNRSSFYNGDYEKKYGDLVKPTRKDLRAAIQLCAVECSQGRPLMQLEMESVVAYLWTIGLKMHDLQLTDEENQTIQKAVDEQAVQEQAIELIKSKYLPYSPATFIDPPENRKKGMVSEGNADNGKLIYELSCQYCHYQNDYSFLLLDNTRMTFKYLSKHAEKYNARSIYQVSRYGTQPKNGKKAYMPQYTLEKLSREQMADLRAYIDREAGK